MQQLHYTDTQQGNVTLVFLHYFGGSGRTWQPVIEKLSDSYRCIAIDLLGFGESPAPTEEPSVHQNRDAVLAIIETLQLQKFVLVGHSMGGKIALSVAVVQPKSVQQIILFAPSPPTAEPMTANDRQELLTAFGNKEKIKQHIQKIIYGSLPLEWLNETVADNLKAAEKAWTSWVNKGSKEDISGETASIQAPLTVVSGSKDKGLTTLFLRTAFSKYFPQASFIEIENSGHLLPLERPDEVVKVIKNALE